ncbi:FISUMP domain-containing protein [Fibrobacter sp. UWB10]|uniref:FISUMP domain-containing protein n=1 Tax=Fibrobacter sp. UWB10 TaxID=1896201 RepID=UPI0024B797E6|nr:FISUMP domain-containing protein [Fibrobacter sp. UWB10]
MRRIFAVVLLICCGASFAHVEKMPDFKDKRDGRVYKTVQIGNQRWFAENLRFKLKGSYCYDNKDYNCETYGRMYDWAMAMRMADFYNYHSITKFDFSSVKGKYHDVCPAGWHVPTNKEWKRLKFYVGKTGKSDGVGISLKAQDLWENEIRIPAGSDEFGFGALPAGERHYIGEFMDLKSSAQFWASNEYDASGAVFWRLTYDSRTFEMVYDAKVTAVSIRCVEDRLYEIKEPPPPPPKVVPQVVKVQNKEIQTIHIGDQVWMANNLNVKVPGSYCLDNKEENCDKYGRLYTWMAALKIFEKFARVPAKDSISKRKPHGICPNGWHIPTALDFYRLETYLKDIDDAVGVGTNLRGHEGWKESEDALLGENGFGFSAMAAGFRDSVGGYNGFETFAGFWSGTEGDSTRALVWTLPYDKDEFIKDSVNKLNAYSIRCLMDPPDEDEIYDSTSIHDKRDDNRYKTVAVGEDVWMAENLRFAAVGSYCYEDKDTRCRNYGRLYPWHVAMRLPADYIENSLDSVSQGAVIAEHQGICPDGWHIPRQEEWVRLGQFAVNKRKGLAAALKSRDGWVQGSLAKNNNASGFNALPAGARFTDGEFTELGSSAYFWAAEGGGGMGAAYWYVLSSKDEFKSEEDFEHNAFSLRCVKNKNVAPKTEATNNDASATPAP